MGTWPGNPPEKPAWQPCTCTHTRPSLTEEMILNYDALPPSLKGWRRFRIEYGFECGCPEETIYLPPKNVYDAAAIIEDVLNGTHNGLDNA